MCICNFYLFVCAFVHAYFKHGLTDLNAVFIILLVYWQTQGEFSVIYLGFILFKSFTRLNYLY